VAKFWIFAASSICAAAFLLTNGQARAATYGYAAPFYGNVLISGDISIPTEITISLTGGPITLGGWPPGFPHAAAFSEQLYAEVLDPDGDRLNPVRVYTGQYCTSFVLGGCSDGDNPPPGEQSFVSFSISDAERLLSIDVEVSSFFVTSWSAGFAITLPDNLWIAPLPASLPLFASALAGLGLLGWGQRHMKRSLRGRPQQ